MTLESPCDSENPSRADACEGSRFRTFADALRLVRLPSGAFGASPRVGSPGRAFGGELVAQAILAATATVEDNRLLHSAHVQFLAGARPDETVSYHVSRLRDGRTFSARSVSATQGKREVLSMLASFQEPGRGLAHQTRRLTGPLPDAIPPVSEQLADDPDNLAWATGLLERRGVELRFPEGPGRVAVSRGHSIAPEQRVWMRLKERVAPDPRCHAAVLAGITDLVFMSTALFPHARTAQDPELEFASLNHTVWVHRPFLLDDWVLFDQYSEWAGEGRGLCHGRIFDLSGALLASVSQEGLMRPRRNPDPSRDTSSPCSVSETFV